MIFLIVLLALIFATTAGFLLALWSIQSGYLNLFDSPREQQILREQLHTLHTAHQLNAQAWQTRRQLQDEARTWGSGQ